jgi:hypothetical protein
MYSISSYFVRSLVLNLLPIGYLQHSFTRHSQHMSMFFFRDERPNYTYVHATQYDKNRLILL